MLPTPAAHLKYLRRRTQNYYSLCCSVSFSMGSLFLSLFLLLVLLLLLAVWHGMFNKPNRIMVSHKIVHHTVSCCHCVWSGKGRENSSKTAATDYLLYLIRRRAQIRSIERKRDNFTTWMGGFSTPLSPGEYCLTDKLVKTNAREQEKEEKERSFIELTPSFPLRVFIFLSPPPPSSPETNSLVTNCQTIKTDSSECPAGHRLRLIWIQSPPPINVITVFTEQLRSPNWGLTPFHIRLNQQRIHTGEQPWIAEGVRHIWNELYLNRTHLSPINVSGGVRQWGVHSIDHANSSSARGVRALQVTQPGCIFALRCDIIRVGDNDQTETYRLLRSWIFYRTRFGIRFANYSRF